MTCENTDPDHVHEVPYKKSGYSSGFFSDCYKLLDTYYYMTDADGIMTMSNTNNLVSYAHCLLIEDCYYWNRNSTTHITWPEGRYWTFDLNAHEGSAPVMFENIKACSVDPEKYPIIPIKFAVNEKGQLSFFIKNYSTPAIRMNKLGVKADGTTERIAQEFWVYRCQYADDPNVENHVHDPFWTTTGNNNDSCWVQYNTWGGGSYGFGYFTTTTTGDPISKNLG